MEGKRIQPIPGKVHVRDRFDDQEYLIDQSSYDHIMDLIKFYHESIYSFSDDERIPAERIEHKGYTIKCDVPINHLVFE